MVGNVLARGSICRELCRGRPVHLVTLYTAVVISGLNFLSPEEPAPSQHLPLQHPRPSRREDSHDPKPTVE